MKKLLFALSLLFVVVLNVAAAEIYECRANGSIGEDDPYGCIAANWVEVGTGSASASITFDPGPGYAALNLFHSLNNCTCCTRTTFSQAEGSYAGATLQVKIYNDYGLVAQATKTASNAWGTFGGSSSYNPTLLNMMGCDLPEVE